MTDLRKAAEMALEALERELDTRRCKESSLRAMNALRQALAQPEQEPIGYIDGMHGGYMVFTPLNPAAVYLNGTALYTAPPKQGYQYEVVAEHADGTYTTRRIPKREWVGLTDDEIYDYADKFLYQHGSNYGIRSFGKAIEAKLKEKNT